MVNPERITFIVESMIHMRLSEFRDRVNKILSETGHKPVALVLPPIYIDGIFVTTAESVRHPQFVTKIGGAFNA